MKTETIFVAVGALALLAFAGRTAKAKNAIQEAVPADGGDNLGNWWQMLNGTAISTYERGTQNHPSSSVNASPSLYDIYR